MQKSNGVIDLSTYREAEAPDAGGSDAGPQYLPAGTELLLGQYKITGYLNCGGFGITYFARDSLYRTVVIKECFPSELCYRAGKTMAVRTPKFKNELASIVSHFVAEAHRLANVRHDNIVHVHQIFEENETAYIAMDFIDGPDLLDIILDDPKRLSPKEVIALTTKLLHAIKHVHDLGFLHRDISPDNILIGKDGEPVLIDFGAAREHAQNSRRPYSRLKFVKDGYSPQEFYLAGSEQGTWSDIYSLAASIHHLVSGAAPADGQARIASLAAKKPDPYVPLAGTVSGYPARFLNAIDKAMAVMPKDRLQTADAWLEVISPQVESARKRPIAAVVDRYERSSISGAVLRVAARKRAVAASVIIAGVGIVALTALQVLGFLGQDASARTPRAEAGLVPFDEVTAAVASAVAPPPAPEWPNTAPEIEHADFSVPPLDAAPGSLKPASLSAIVPERVAFVAPDPVSKIAPPLTSISPAVSPGLGNAVRAPSALDPAPVPQAIAALSVVTGDNPVSRVAPPPAPAPKVVAQQVLWSRQDIRMPFDGTPERVRNADTIRITSIDPDADLTVSGDWIAEDVVLYSFNGERLKAETSLDEHIRASLAIDPDGYARATVRYRDPVTQRIDRGLLAVPVVRETGLADGTVLETRTENLARVTRVAAPASGTDLRAGDILVGEARSGISFSGHEDIARALTALADRDFAEAEFTVLRDGTRQTVRWRLAPE